MNAAKKKVHGNCRKYGNETGINELKCNSNVCCAYCQPINSYP